MCKKLIYFVPFVLLLGLFPMSVAKSDDPDLVGYWRFDEGSGTTAYDSSGNGNDGTVNGGAQWVAGQLGGALEFNGSNSYVSAPHIPLNSRSFTITMWVNPVLYTDQTVVFGQVQTGSQNLSMHYRLWGDGRVRMGFYSNDLDTVAGTVADNNWYHITFWYDFENQTRRVYINGAQEAEDNGGPYLGTSGDTRIGQWNNNQWFQGIIDDVRIYTRALTDVEILGVMAGGGAEYPLASGPNPADGALLEDTWANLSWRAGDSAVSHDVYIGDNFDDVNAGAEGVFQGNQAGTNLVIGFLGFPYPEGLVPGTTYYWRIDEVNDTEPNSPWKGDVWSFWIPPRIAYNPDPADGVKFVDTDAELNWTAGFGAKLHYVYFGDNFDDVNSAIVGLPQTDTTYTPGTLELGKLYYWRVDESDGITMQKGDVWSFKTLPDIPITDPNLVGWWKLDEGYGTTAIDWSGHGNHGTLQGDPQWVAGYDGDALEFDGSNSYVAAPYIPLNSRSFTITMWVNPVLYTDQQVVFAQHQDGSTNLSMHFRLGGPDIGAGNNVPPRAVRMGFYGNDLDTASGLIEDNTWYHITFLYDFENQNRRIYINGAQEAEDNGDPYLGTTGDTRIGQWNNNQWFQGIIDDVRIYIRVLTVEEIQQTMRGDPLLAGVPNPTNGSTPYIKEATPLNWSPGENASQHDVYFGIDRDAVADANASDTTGIYRGRQGVTIYTPPEVEWGGGPYYWRIDEYNTDATISKGNVWSFTVADFIGIDDIEDYNDYPPDEIFSTWIDGWEVPENGSMAGHVEPPFAETGNVHGGSQSMPVYYENNFKCSEITMTLVSVRDWTEEGVGVLSLWFYGDAANAAERMYVNLNGIATVYHNNPDAALIDEWTEWTIDLSAPGGFAVQGVNLANVNTISIGFGDKNNLQAGGSGMVLFDDIRLYQPAP